MLRFVLISVLGHLVVASLFWIPWGWLQSSPSTAMQSVIPLELVTIGPQTTIPPQMQKEPAPQKEPQEKPMEPEEPLDAAAPPPESAPTPPEPAQPPKAPEEPVKIPEPQPDQKKLAEEKPITPPKVEKKKETSPSKPTPEEKKDKKKKKKDDDFLDSVIKDLTPKKTKDKKKGTQKSDKSTPQKKASSTGDSDTTLPPMEGIPGDRLSLSEIDAIRSQVASCWNVPAGLQNAENLKVEVRVHVEPDGRVKKVDILSMGRMGDPLFRAAAESAVRALLNPRCSPLKIPLNKYNEWKTFRITFDPKEMF